MPDARRIVSPGIGRPVPRLADRLEQLAATIHSEIAFSASASTRGAAYRREST